MSNAFFLDTNVLIEWLKHGDKASALIESEFDFLVSDIVFGEILQGVRNQNELNFILKNFSKLFKIYYSNEAIHKRALEIMKSITLKSGIDYLDALIASMSIQYDIPLISMNEKHFKDIKNLEFIHFR